MWSSKMAAQWRPIDEALNAGNGDFLSIRNPCQIGSCGGTMGAEDMDTRSCMERSVLAIFDEPASSSEDTRQAEEESETLLSALNQMLECVEDDVGSTLSPFDTLPDTKLLNCQEFGNSMTTDEVAFTAKLRPRTINGAGKEDKSKVARLQPVFQHKSRTFFQGPNKKADTQVNIFTTSSLVNLVKLMHPYCLKMHVEEEGRDHRGTAGPLSPWDKLQKKHTIFSQGEIWKYKKPTADSDEDINVVSDDDDDTPLKEREGKEGIAKKESSTPLKSAFLTSKSSKGPFPRAKKKVRFGPVQVASFDQSVEVGFDEKTLPSVAAADPPNDRVLIAPTTASILSDLKNQAEAPPPKGEGKAKSLSLQEYRQLRQERHPLVETKGSNTTRWPSVSKPPKELPPILCSHGQRQNLCEMKSSLCLIEKSTISPDPRQRAPCKATCRHPPGALDKKPLLAVRHRRSKSPQSESEHTSLDGSKCRDEHSDFRVKGAASKTSPLKNRTALSTDPPNPVIIHLPVSPTANPSNSHSSLMSSVEHSVAASQIQQSTMEPHSSHEVECYFPITPQTKSSSECRETQNLMPQISQSVNSEPVTCDQGQSVREVLAEGPTRFSLSEKARPSFQYTRRNQSAAAESGIEACDLTSLLEQFEEKQTEEADPAILSNALPANLHKDTERKSMPMRTSTKEPKPVRTLNSVKAKRTIKYLERQRNLEHATPEPVSADVILDTREVVSLRRRTPASKGIQIIDPRPLPCRKTNATDLAAAPHICSSVSTDHDYCMSVDDLHPRAPPSLLRNTREVEVTSSFVKCNQICNSPIRTDEKYQSASSTCTPTAPSYTQLTPPPSPPSRGREKRRYSRRSPLSDVCSSSSSSPSRSPKRSHCEHSGSRSSSPSGSASPSPPRRRKLSCTCLTSNRSRLRSWSRSRSPSPSSPTFHTRRRNVYRKSWKLKREHKARLQKLKAIDERRVVYVGRIRRSMTHDELRERFSYFGEVECVSLHFRDKGDHYGFVTFYRMDDAFAAIDNGAKLRRPDELPFDICFGGRRQFCNSDYADLDAKVDAEQSPAKSRFQELDFDSLLKQAQRGLR
ncbi:peroxisome proliferator-activated receptor gamma coactivator-related protein 1-like [Hippocampus zosterae]|uniref:peroxisome proliferator-activated receptor gamma coactivator-related protein 1-like n=1 Tax=Hippocampus zosterae TaxID=109293 RepID=UPI00223C90D1|nr:peroxisome proliferator-activated receptor gamma coactivator-related protein 1-like [Hippocampus zosterae]